MMLFMYLEKSNITASLTVWPPTPEAPSEPVGVLGVDGRGQRHDVRIDDGLEHRPTVERERLAQLSSHSGRILDADGSQATALRDLREVHRLKLYPIFGVPEE